ncbi:hypothetical protein PY479_12155 [Shewanella sp. A32]|uniref:hypothetical protein n=1 Tax=Shewanella sp. A32 TaxID=3031327 RepID=UPI0023B9B402|nr:hypothetical protein [Shewanella sp. A32]MDF0535025.1 hypothetical protein [Shewanella sp. A32]
MYKPTEEYQDLYILANGEIIEGTERTDFGINKVAKPEGTIAILRECHSPRSGSKISIEDGYSKEEVLEALAKGKTPT